MFHAYASIDVFVRAWIFCNCRRANEIITMFLVFTFFVDLPGAFFSF